MPIFKSFFFSNLGCSGSAQQSSATLSLLIQRRRYQKARLHCAFAIQIYLSLDCRQPHGTPFSLSPCFFTTSNYDTRSFWEKELYPNRGSLPTTRTPSCLLVLVSPCLSQSQMPVPVPHFSKAPAHPVYKPRQAGEDANQNKASALQQLTHSLPASAGPPPSFGTREEWINSLPSWRKLKPRRIWEDACAGEGRGGNNFSVGLTRAGNGSVIKGAHAQACIPPLYTLFQNPSLTPVSPQRGGEDADDEMSSDCSVMDQGQHDNESQWSASSPIATSLDPAMDVVKGGELQYGPVEDDRPGWHRDDGAVFEEAHFVRGAFSPIYEDESPEMIRGHDVSSSPIGPATPFGDFVDRAVAAAETYTSLGALPNIMEQSRPVDGQYHQYPPVQQESKEPPSTSEPVTTPSSTITYKKLAEPLSNWVATYVWKLCTTGLSLPSGFAVSMYAFSLKQSRVPTHFILQEWHTHPIR